MAVAASGVTAEEIASRLRRTPDQLGGSDYLFLIIELVEAAIAVRADAEFGVGMSELDADRLALVVREVAALIVRRETSSSAGESSRTVSIDDATVTKRFESADDVTPLLDRWWSMLTPSGAGSRGAFTVSPSYAADVDFPMPLRGWRGGW